MAEQRFLNRRRINFTALARQLGVTATTVRDVALGSQFNRRVMEALLEEWRRVKAETADYEFWREA